MLFRLILLFALHLFCAANDTHDQLIQVHILFRHGNRFPDPEFTLNSSDLNQVEFAKLTQDGVTKMYQVGRQINRRYYKFLRKYPTDFMEARSTDFNRTKESLLLVIAGLFHPNFVKDMNENIKTLKIPYRFEKLNQDTEFFGLTCQETKQLIKNFVESPEFEKMYPKYETLASYLRKHGTVVHSPIDVYLLFMTLRIKDELHVPIPEWAVQIYPEPISYYGTHLYKLLTATDQLKTYTAGFMLKNILQASLKIIINGKYPKKFVLLAGHDLNIGALLTALGVFKKPHLPPYGSQVIVELHRINGVYGFKIFYNDFKRKNPRLLSIPKCGTFCRYDKFMRLYQNILPTEDTECHK